jgi:hypothetical protein
LNLTQAAARECDLLCDVRLNDTFPASLTIEGARLAIPTQAPTLTFNGNSYTFTGAGLQAPSLHALDGNLQPAEFLMWFARGDGAGVLVGVFVNPKAVTGASQEFFATLAQNTRGPNQTTSVALDGTWSLSHVLPTTPSYYVYKSPVPGGGSSACLTHVVYDTSVSINPTDLAVLTKSQDAPLSFAAQAPTDAQHLWYNNGSDQPTSEETLNANDDRLYVVCEPAHPNDALSAFGSLGQAPANDKPAAPAAPPPKLESMDFLVVFQSANTQLVIVVLLSLLTGAIGVYIGSYLGFYWAQFLLFFTRWLKPPAVMV